MTPAKADILNAALAPHWDLLRQWTDTALADHQHSRERLTAEELVALRRWIVVIEAMLRRLVLLAATGIEVDPDVVKSWSGPPKTAPDPTADADTNSGACPDTEQGAGAASPEEPAARRKRTFRLFSRTRSNTASGGAGSQAASPTPPETGAAHEPQAQHETRRRFNVSTEPPELTPEQYRAWFDAQPPTTAADRGKAVWDQMTYQPPPRKPPKTRRGPRLERKTLPELISTGSFIERLQFVAELAANPGALIQRAAVEMARRRQLAYLASLEPAPRPRGILAGCVELYATVIPFHAAFSDLMCRFALSYTEPDTS